MADMEQWQQAALLPEEEDTLEEGSESRSFTVERSGERLDLFLASQNNGEISRSRIQRLIQDGGVLVNGIARRANHKLSCGDTVTMTMEPPQELEVTAEDIPLDIVYQDQDICVINKPKGMVVHPAAGNQTGTMVNALLFHIKDLSGVGGVLRPGIVHRIDKFTSGLIVVAKNDMAHQSLSAQIKAHTAGRTYLAIVLGNLREDSGMVDLPIGRHPIDRKKMSIRPDGRPSVTHWKVLERFEQYTLLRLKLETGRTHQIRVHMSHLKHPVAGDTVYGPEKNKLGLTGQALHAWKLELAHPRTGEQMAFAAQPPEDFLQALKRIGWNGTRVWEEGPK